MEERLGKTPEFILRDLKVELCEISFNCTHVEIKSSTVYATLVKKFISSVHFGSIESKKYPTFFYSHIVFMMTNGKSVSFPMEKTEVNEKAAYDLCKNLFATYAHNTYLFKEYNE